MPDLKSNPLSGRWWSAGIVALVLGLAACTSSPTEGPSTPAAADAGTSAPATPSGAPPTETAAPSTPAGDVETAAPSTPTGDAEAAVPPTPSPEPASDEDSPELPDNASELMRATLRGNVAAVIEQMAASGDRSFIPVLMEMMRFLPPYDARLCVTCSLNKLLEGPDNDEVPPERQDWGWWMEWLGNHPEVQPPDGFAGWKGELYSVIDPDFKDFFYDGVKTRVRLEEVAWGGVNKDGIPDLNMPPAIPAEEAAYLLDSDRVFGLSINGERRAYPLRILNPHEMANDVLGGEPFALAY